MGEKIRIASLFSGIGGFETGLFAAFGKENVEVVFASEIDTYANQAYAYLYGHPTAGDVTAVDAHDIPAHDVLVAGFPCQDFSLAGLQLGFEGTRGTLFFEVVRIAKEKQPEWLFLENVRNLVNHDKGRTMEVIVRTLSELNYTVDFTVLNSKYFGVPHNRERVYILAKRNGKEEPWHTKDTTKAVVKAKKRFQTIEGVKSFNFPFPEQGRVECRLRDILREEVPMNLYLEEEKERAFLTRIGDKSEMDYSAPIGLQFVGGITDKPNWLDNGKELSRNYKQGSRVYDADGLSSTLSAQGVGGLGGHTGLYRIPSGRIRRLSVEEAFRLQAFPDDYVETLKEKGISASQLYKMAGNAVTTTVIEAIAKRMNL